MIVLLLIHHVALTSFGRLMHEIFIRVIIVVRLIRELLARIDVCSIGDTLPVAFLAVIHLLFISLLLLVDIIW